MKYYLPFHNIALSTSALTFKTVAALHNNNTLGHRFRISAVKCFSVDDAPGDDNILVRLRRQADAATSGGTGTTVASANIPKVDPDSEDCVVNARRDFTVEPGGYATEPMENVAHNDHGGYIGEWFDPDDKPKAHKNQMIGLEVACKTAEATAKRVSGVITFERW